MVTRYTGRFTLPAPVQPRTEANAERQERAVAQQTARDNSKALVNLRNKPVTVEPPTSGDTDGTPVVTGVPMNADGSCPEGSTLIPAVTHDCPPGASCSASLPAWCKLNAYIVAPPPPIVEDNPGGLSRLMNNAVAYAKSNPVIVGGAAVVAYLVFLRGKPLSGMLSGLRGRPIRKHSKKHAKKHAKRGGLRGCSGCGHCKG